MRSEETKPEEPSRFVDGLDNFVLFLLIIPFAFFGFILVKTIWFFCDPSGNNLRLPSVESTRTSENDQEECPICMESLTFGVETDCAHRFCARCFCLHWKRTLYSRHITCPMCRSHVHTLTKRFTQEENELSSAQKSALSADIDLFNRWHSNLPVPIWQRVRDLPTLARALTQLLFSNEGAMVLLHSRLIFLGICVLLYILSPFDLIPEIVTGIFGLLDDLLVFFIFAVHAYAVYRATLIRPIATMS
ncbi:hypothetical protein EG68_05667 [Paragonimus skrjabini miyazakii]|uniref:E3 ubiquitin-protein ligase RNF170 n=1 Tax=Paragonimus skrjabini miyazakii TaxID=59628 RepID=A0A8S9Z2D5_9TREM|nr:hypothetical protein EG68_05667 [Paragonimus skrjabini miyazakii]